MIVPLAVLLLLIIALAMQGLLCFHMNFWIAFPISVKNRVASFSGIVLNW